LPLACPKKYIADSSPKGDPGDNLLGFIAESIDFNDEARKGQWVGFFSYLERVLLFHAQRSDVFAEIDRHRAELAEMSSEVEAELDRAGRAA